MRALALPLELQDAVHQVLEHPGPGQRPLLGHVADQDHGDVVALGGARHPIGHLAHLSHRAGGAAQLRRVQGLDRVDHAHVRPLALQRGHHHIQVGLGHGRDPQRVSAQPAGAQGHLGGRFLAGDVERPPPGRRQTPQGHRGERGLPDAGRPAEEDQRARHQPSAQDAIELADPGLEPLHRRRSDVGQRDRRHRRRPAHRPAAPGGGQGRPLLDQRVPGAAAGALPEPLRRGVAAGGADVDGGGTGHAPEATRRLRRQPRRGAHP